MTISAKIIKFQLMLATLSTIAFSTQIQPANSRPQSEYNTNTDAISNNLDSIFKIGTGKMVFKVPPSNIRNSKSDANDGIVVSTKAASNSDTQQLDQLHPEQFEKFAAFFKDDYLPPKNVTNRIDGGIVEEYYCSSKSRIIHPKGGETRESKWVLVVQHRHHRQGVLVEQCERENVQCKYNELLPLGVTSKCKQHFVYRTMVVFVEGVLKEEMIKLPNYCDCVLYFNPTRRRN
ncbi:uncharacterized protein [Eurosta solidaginis]|uniref:uncharacterized protein n=1 Tax=Eurosta solidaginis TaxID=178769 RepID=UPI0035310408